MRKSALAGRRLKLIAATQIAWVPIGGMPNQSRVTEIASASFLTCSDPGFEPKRWIRATRQSETHPHMKPKT